MGLFKDIGWHCTISVTLKTVDGRELYPACERQKSVFLQTAFLETVFLETVFFQTVPFL